MKLPPSAKRSCFRGLVLAAFASAPFAVFGQPIYQWSFNDSTGVPSVTVGGGTLIPGGTADFLADGVSGNSGDKALNLSNSYTGGVGSGNNALAGGENVLTGAGTLSSFTVTMWVKLSAGSLSNFPRLLQLGATSSPDSNSNPGINMLVNSGNLEIGVNGQNAQIAAGFAAGTWKFVAFSYDGTSGANSSTTSGTLYGLANNAVVLTGSLTNTVAVVGSGGLNTSPGPVDLGAAATLYLGNRANGDRGYTGQIDDVRIYNTQLSVAELEAIRLESAPPPPAGGVPYYWKGSTSADWSADNWTSDLAGTTPATLPTDGTAAATFTADGAANFTNTLLGAAQNVKSIDFNAQATAVDIGGTHGLTIGAGGIAVAGDAGAVSLGTTGGVALDANQTWTNNSASPLTVSSSIGGAFALTTAGTGQTILSAANTHAGTVTQAGTLTLGDALALGAGDASLNVEGGTLDLNGFSPQIGNLSGTTLGTVTNRAEGTTATLVVNTPALATDTFSGHLNNGSATQVLALTKTGPGTLFLSSTGNFTGNILVSDGTLAASVTLFSVPNNTSIGNAQAPGRTVTIQDGATFRFDNLQILGNQGDFTLLPAFVVEAGGTLASSRYNIIGAVTLQGGTMTQSSTDGTGYFFKGSITANGGVASLISSPTGTPNHLDSNTSIEVAADSSLTISGPLADDAVPSGFTKTGPGTLTLGAANTYTGPTTLAAGALVLSSPNSLSDTAIIDVTNSASATLELNYTGTDFVSGVTIDGVPVADGTIGRIGSGATHTYAWITGDGLISIGTPPSTTPLQDWRLAWFGTTEAIDDAANDADPDADGVVNLLEYALGGDPTTAETDLSPVQAVDADHLTLSFSRIADGTLTYTVQACDDLASWLPVWTSTGAENVEGVVTVTDPEELSSHVRRFLRLQVTTP